MSTKISILNNGPLIVEGQVSLADGAGKEFGLAGREKIFLCRCGHSTKKPFCDGAHKAKGFEDACQAYDINA